MIAASSAHGIEPILPLPAGSRPALAIDAYFFQSLPEIWFAILLFTLAMYLFLDGFDFGIGIIFGLRDDEDERELLLTAFGPVWDANEVWLVAFGTILLAAFPPAYSALLSDHYLLIFAIIFALLLRGVSPELREQRTEDAWQRACDRGFVAGSILSPLFLGMLAGSWAFGTGALSLPAVLTAVVVLPLSVAAGSGYLATKTRGAFQTALRRIGELAILGYLGSVVVLLASVWVLNPQGHRATLIGPPIVGLVAASVFLGILAIGAFRLARPRAGFLAVGCMTFGLTGILAAFLYPTVYPAAGMTIRDAVVSPVALNVISISVIPLLLLVLFYFRYLYRVFSGPIEGEGGYGQSH